ncbi:MAG TPA: flagellar motor protein MotA, partial [Rhodospirillales bacterium]|nr:flagellar motor protein MotA [Rhodospirillales bacterium]
MTNPQRFLNRVALFLLATLIVVGAVYDILWRAFMHNPALNGL